MVAAGLPAVTLVPWLRCASVSKYRSATGSQRVGRVLSQEQLELGLDLVEFAERQGRGGSDVVHIGHPTVVKSMHPVGCLQGLLVLMIPIFGKRQRRKDLWIFAAEGSRFLQMGTSGPKILHGQRQQAEIQERSGKFLVQFCGRFFELVLGATILLIEVGQAERVVRNDKLRVGGNRLLQVRDRFFDFCAFKSVVAVSNSSMALPWSVQIESRNGPGINQMLPLFLLFGILLHLPVAGVQVNLCEVDFLCERRVWTCVHVWQLCLRHRAANETEGKSSRMCWTAPRPCRNSGRGEDKRRR